MKTLRHILACALLLAAFAACTDDFATPSVGEDRVSVVSDEAKPGDDATAGGGTSGAGGDDKDEKDDPTAGDGESKPGN